MMDDGKFYQCPTNKTNSVVEAQSQESAKIALYCKACSLDKLGRCRGPVEVERPEQVPIVSPKRRGRQPRMKPENSSPAKPTPTDEERCRQALRALAVSVRPDYAGMIAPFRQEIRAARAAGRGWDIISKTLKQFGYKIGVNALRRLDMEKESEQCLS